MGEASGIKKNIEAMLFVYDKPLTIAQIGEVCPDAAAADIEQALAQLKEEYNCADSGIHLFDIAGGYQFSTNPDCADALRLLFKTKRVIRLSSPALETLAIIAYKQPVTRAEIEFIRGVNVEGVLKTLLDRSLIKPQGVKDVPGRPQLFVTTAEFLYYFGLKNLRELPSLEAFPAAALEGMSDVDPAAAAETPAAPAPEENEPETPEESAGAAAESVDSLSARAPQRGDER
ncbi:MAG: SMC-Scp complex subunit ScpB [Candidatus Omnitrophica bacterium]|nr:SMC-Scp complex subunit ScpB [Candidatus Omnitrophota bacterium]